MALAGLSCDTIGELDNGTARGIVNAELLRAVSDLDDRGHEDGKARKVTIELTMTNHNGLLAVSVAAQAKLPPFQSGLTNGVVREQRTKRGTQKVLHFQESNADNPDQPTFDDVNGAADNE